MTPFPRMAVGLRRRSTPAEGLDGGHPRPAGINQEPPIRRRMAFRESSQFLLRAATSFQWCADLAKTPPQGLVASECRRQADLSPGKALLRLLLARVVGRIDVGNRERPLHVHLNCRSRRSVCIVMHVRHCNAISTGRQRERVGFVDHITHAD